MFFNDAEYVEIEKMAVKPPRYNAKKLLHAASSFATPVSGSVFGMGGFTAFVKPL